MPTNGGLNGQLTLLRFLIGGIVMTVVMTLSLLGGMVWLVEKHNLGLHPGAAPLAAFQDFRAEMRRSQENGEEFQREILRGLQHYNQVLADIQRNTSRRGSGGD